MNDTDESSLADPRNVFLRQLSVRSELIARRVDGFVGNGWDINGLALIHAESRRLAEGSVLHEFPATVEVLGDIAEILCGVLEREELPDPQLGARLHDLSKQLQQRAPPAPATFSETYVPANLAEEFALMKAADAARGDPAPSVTIEQTHDPWGDDVALFGKSGASGHNPALLPASAIAKGRAAVPATLAAPTGLAANAAAATARWPAATADGKPPAMPSDFRLYHLTDYGPLSLELDQRLEAMGLEVELLEDVAELTELLCGRGDLRLTPCEQVGAEEEHQEEQQAECVHGPEHFAAQQHAERDARDRPNTPPGAAEGALPGTVVKEGRHFWCDPLFIDSQESSAADSPFSARSAPSGR